MSVLFAEDFKGYGTTNDLMLDGLYAEIGNAVHLTEDPDPNASGIVFQTFSNAVDGYRLRRVFPASRNTIGTAFRLWMDQLPGNNASRPSVSFLVNDNTAICSISVSPIGAIQFHIGYGNTDPFAVSGPVLTAHAWNHIEFKAETNVVGGIAVIKVNGVTVLTTAEISTAAAAAQITWANPGATGLSQPWYVKDWVVWDTLGGVNDDFMGTVQVIGRTLTSDSTLGGWVPSTGTTGHNLLNNSPPLDGTDYVTAGHPVPLPASFGLSQLSDDITSVRALITQVRARKIDGGDGTLQVSLVSNGDTDAGADRPITSAFAYYEDVSEIDPDTSSSWTPVSADAALVKIDRTT